MAEAERLTRREVEQTIPALRRAAAQKGQAGDVAAMIHLDSVASKMASLYNQGLPHISLKAEPR